MTGCLDLDFGYTFLVERFIAIPVRSQFILMACWGVFNLYMANGGRRPLQSHWYIHGRR